MKKVLIGLGVVVVLLIGGVYLLFSNLDAIVETAIEQAGSDAVGSEVAVDSVALDLTGGKVSIMGFSVANPPGFSANDMVSFDELTVNIDVASLQQEVIRINSIVARNPFVRYESEGGTSNVDTVSSRFASDEEAPVEEESGPGQQLSIGSILVESIEATLSVDQLPSDIDVNLGDIRLENLEGTPDEIASQVMGPLLSQISAVAAEAVISSLGDLLGEELPDAADLLGEEASESLDSVREGLGNLLNRD